MFASLKTVKYNFEMRFLLKLRLWPSKMVKTILISFPFKITPFEHVNSLCSDVPNSSSSYQPNRKVHLQLGSFILICVEYLRGITALMIVMC